MSMQFAPSPELPGPGWGPYAPLAFCFGLLVPRHLWCPSVSTGKSPEVAPLEPRTLNTSTRVLSDIQNKQSSQSHCPGPPWAEPAASASPLPASPPHMPLTRSSGSPGSAPGSGKAALPGCHPNAHPPKLKTTAETRH